MNVLVHETFKHKSNGGCRAHDDVHALVNPTHAVEARASAGGFRDVMSAVAWHHGAKGIKEERCLEEPCMTSSRGAKASVSIDAVTDFGRVQHAAERDPFSPRATIFALGVGRTERRIAEPTSRMRPTSIPGSPGQSAYFGVSLLRSTSKSEESDCSGRVTGRDRLCGGGGSTRNVCVTAGPAQERDRKEIVATAGGRGGPIGGVRRRGALRGGFGSERVNFGKADGESRRRAKRATFQRRHAGVTAWRWW